MPVFNKENKGQIGQGFNNPNSIYAGRGGMHRGIDYVVGHKRPVKCDNDGYVYKDFKAGDLEGNWRGVYMLVPTDDPDVFMEIVQGHFDENYVKRGDYVKANQVIGTQGNHGFVYGTYQGKFQQVPVWAQLDGSAGDAGSHVHESRRPVRRSKVKGNYCLLKENGRSYKDDDGYYYNIIYENNGIKGFVDPSTYGQNDNADLIAVMTKEIEKITMNKQFNNELADLFEKHKDTPAAKEYAQAFLPIAIKNA